MGYDTPLTVLSLVPTRDGLANPSRRCPDKHARLFCGKTLDEWTMIQLWASKYCSRGRSVFICETEAHAERLQPAADKWGIELMVRDEGLLHPVTDSGGVVLTMCLMKLLQQAYYPLVQTPLVVSPCRPPWLFDFMVDAYLTKMPESGGDFDLNGAEVLGAYQTELTFWSVDERGVMTKVGPHVNRVDRSWAYTASQHWVAASWFYLGVQMKWFARWDEHCGEYRPLYVEIPRWTDIHIDTPEDWDLAEYWFRKKILSEGEDCYARYREGWEG